MLRNVVVCRHAEATSSTPNLVDFSRPLTPKGFREAGQAGQWLKEQKLAIGAFMSSPALRAKETSTALARHMGWDERHIFFDESIYHASDADLLKLISSLAPEVPGILLVGHNPAVSTLGSHLCEKEGLHLDPSQILVISVSLKKWEDIFIATGTCTAHFVPR
ncbi:hypothetical protein BH24BAC1_BH24BAC1_00660 [soil metagenome]